MAISDPQPAKPAIGAMPESSALATTWKPPKESCTRSRAPWTARPGQRVRSGLHAGARIRPFAPLHAPSIECTGRRVCPGLPGEGRDGWLKQRQGSASARSTSWTSAPSSASTRRSAASYRPEVWERRIGYYLRRDPEASVVAEADGKVVGFMLGEVRSGEFGLEEPTGWIEVLGVDPGAPRQAVGRRMARGHAGALPRPGRPAACAPWSTRRWARSAASSAPSASQPSTLRPFVRTSVRDEEKRG